MTNIVIIITILSAMVMFIPLLKGPTIPDRIVAANAVGIMFFSLIILLTLLYEADIFLDIALVYAILQFVDILVMAKYLDRKGGPIS